MEITKTTTIIWESEQAQENNALHLARMLKLDEMANQGKTELSLLECIDSVTTKRFWIDQSAAEEFITFITAQAELNDCKIVSAVIEDYTPPV